MDFGRLSLGQHRVYFVTGKGGTGKTSVSVGIARALARQGKRVLLLELDAPRPTLPSYFGGQVGYEPTRMTTRIEGANLDFFSALRSYVESVVPVKRVVGLILKNKVVRVFLTATPGARELVLLSRLWELSLDPRWDHLVVDLPASGHAVALFRCPFLARRVFGRGPLKKRADEIIERLGDPSVASLVFCALPGEMPVNETLETRDALGALGIPHIGGVLLNHFPDEFLSDTDVALLKALETKMEGGDAPWRVAAATEAAGELRRRQSTAIASLERLREAFDGRSGILPELPGTHSQVSESISLMLAESVS